MIAKKYGTKLAIDTLRTFSLVGEQRKNTYSYCSHAELNGSVPLGKKEALVVAISEHVNEDVTLVIDGFTVNCFASVCPYEISIGNTYNVELSLTLAENYEIQNVTSIDFLIEKKGDGFAYFLYGKLCNDVFNTFTVFHDEEIHYKHPNLNDQLIKLEVSRIDAAFFNAQTAITFMQPNWNSGTTIGKDDGHF